MGVNGNSRARWEIEWRVRQLAAETSGVAFERVTLDSRLLEDLDIDSLAIVELAMAIEDEFEIDLPDQDVREYFTRVSASVRTLVDLVIERTGMGKPDRTEWHLDRPELPIAEEVPFTQLGPLAGEVGKGDLHEPLGRNREGFLEVRRRSDGMRCVCIPAGSAILGSDAEEALEDQRPSHRVEISEFLMDAEPVSNAAYARFLNSIGDVPQSMPSEWCGVDEGSKRALHYPLERTRRGWAPAKGTEHQPMILVSWLGANAYSLWAHGCDWRLYRGEHDSHCIYLPSEAQWEYAARGVELETARVARHKVGASYAVDSLPSARVSERLGMSSFGLHHMAGNVWQWCNDWYAADFYQRPEALVVDPQNRTPTGIRSERGGSWVGPARLAVPSYRRGRPPSARGRCLGFRCCTTQTKCRE